MTRWRKARKKPAVVEFREVEPKENLLQTREGWLKGEMVTPHEGILMAISGRDYIIRGVEGELYPIKKEIFEKTYKVIKER